MSRMPHCLRALAACCLWWVAACVTTPPERSRPIAMDVLLPGATPAAWTAIADGVAQADALMRLVDERRVSLAMHRAGRDFAAASGALVAALTAGVMDPDRVHALAGLLDRAFAAEVPKGAFAALVRGVETSRPEFEQYLRARDRLMAALAANDLAQSLSLVPLPHPGGDPSGWFELEAAALAALLRDLAGDTGGAMAAYAECEALARSHGWQRYAGHLALLTAEVATRGGDAEVASSSWGRAVATGVALLREPHDAVDPDFWERAVLFGDAPAWPEEAVGLFARAARLPLRSATAAGLSQERGEVILWLAIADAFVDLNQPLQGLLAYRRAGEMALTGRGRDLARVQEARALLALGRFADARAVLAGGLAQLDDVALREGLAHLGAIELAEERPERAAAILGKALEVAGKPVEFPSRSEATANFGLALLMTTRVDEGMERLHEAQARFAGEHDMEGLVQALENELEAARQLGLDAEAARIEERLISVP